MNDSPGVQADRPIHATNINKLFFILSHLINLFIYLIIFTHNKSNIPDSYNNHNAQMISTTMAVPISLHNNLNTNGKNINTATNNNTSIISIFTSLSHTDRDTHQHIQRMISAKIAHTYILLSYQ